MMLHHGRCRQFYSSYYGLLNDHHKSCANIIYMSVTIMAAPAIMCLARFVPSRAASSGQEMMPVRLADAPNSLARARPKAYYLKPQRRTSYGLAWDNLCMIFL
eukprot:scaffold127242_cov17-Prasinocladus_malaysianus.AAC.1